MTDTLVSQFDVEYVFDDTADSLRITQFDLSYIWNIPSISIQSSQFDLSFVSEGTAQLMDVSQLDLLYVYRGRVADPKVRCFTFTLDGHDFYVIRLGTIETLVFDTQTNQFYIWGSGDSLLWRAYDGCNWLGGYAQSAGFGSNIVVGDDGNGSIYFLNPDADTDDDAIEGSTLQRDFVRRASGQVITKGYSSVRCYGVELLGSIGQYAGAAPSTVTLDYSDDRGQSYVDAGTYTIDSADYEARLFWRSLGSIRAPGRIFRVTDYGALKRIDSLDMVAEGEGKT
jgi:hypothetical protein